MLTCVWPCTALETRDQASEPGPLLVTPLVAVWLAPAPIIKATTSVWPGATPESVTVGVSVAAGGLVEAPCTQVIGGLDWFGVRLKFAVALALPVTMTVVVW